MSEPAESIAPAIAEKQTECLALEQTDINCNII